MGTVPTCARYLFGAGVGLIAVSSCGGSTSDGADPDPAVVAELDAACAELGRAMCERRSACTIPTELNRRYVNDEQCRERSALACRGWATLPGSNLDAVTVTSCAAEIVSADCRQATSLFWWESELPWCLAAGKRADAEACASGAQCQSRHCAIVDGCGKCAAVRVSTLIDGHAGDACDDPSVVCVRSTSCMDGVCTETECPVEGCHDSGAVCGFPIGGLGDTVYCGLGTECKNANDMGRGTCMPYVADGEACADWAGPPCLFPARCVDDVCRLPDDLDCR